MKKTASVVFALALALVALSPRMASASPITGTYTTGGATLCAAGPALPCLLTSTDSTSSILRFVFSAPVQFSDLSSLSVDYTAILGGIAAGSPRIVLVTDANNDTVADGQFIIHWGPAGSFADPSLGAGTTGNLLALNDLGRYDLGGIGGSAYTDRAAALALAGSLSILRASLVIDSFGGNDRSFLINGFGASSAAAVPEPGTLGLLGAGLVGFAVTMRRRKAANKSGVD